MRLGKGDRTTKGLWNMPQGATTGAISCLPGKLLSAPVGHGTPLGLTNRIGRDEIIIITLMLTLNLSIGGMTTTATGLMIMSR